MTDVEESEPLQARGQQPSAFVGCLVMGLILAGALGTAAWRFHRMVSANEAHAARELAAETTRAAGTPARGMDECLRFGPGENGGRRSIDEVRLREYLAVRGAVRDADDERRGRIRALPSSGEREAAERAWIAGELQLYWLQLLQAASMPPREWYSITAALYPSTFGKELQNYERFTRPQVEALRQELRAKLQAGGEEIDPETLQSDLELIEADLGAWPTGGPDDLAEDRVWESPALLARYAKRIRELEAEELDIRLTNVGILPPSRLVRFVPQAP